MVFLLGDFNAQVGRNRDRWYPSLGKFCVEKKTAMAIGFCNFVRNYQATVEY